MNVKNKSAARTRTGIPAAKQDKKSAGTLITDPGAKFIQA